MSKTYSLTGWRIGWAIAPEPVTARIRKVHDFLTVGAARPLQVATATALKMPDSYYNGLADRYRQARDYLFNVLEESGFNPNLPQGAYYIICRVNELMDKFGVENDTQFCFKLIDLCGVAAVPGSSFYSDKSLGRDQIRFCYCKRMQTLEDAGQRLLSL